MRRELFNFFIYVYVESFYLHYKQLKYSISSFPAVVDCIKSIFRMLRFQLGEFNSMFYSYLKMLLYIFFEDFINLILYPMENINEWETTQTIFLISNKNCSMKYENENQIRKITYKDTI